MMRSNVCASVDEQVEEAAEAVSEANQQAEEGEEIPDEWDVRPQEQHCKQPGAGPVEHLVL